MSWQVVFAKHALKDAKKLSAAGLRDKAQELLALLAHDPFLDPPPYEKLVGDLEGAYSRRINIQHRLVYEVFKKERVVRVLRMWTHYECREGNRSYMDDDLGAGHRRPKQHDHRTRAAFIRTRLHERQHLVLLREPAVHLALEHRRLAR